MSIKIGDLVLIYFDHKRKFVVRVEPGKEVHTDEGIVKLDDLVGLEYGSTAKSHLGTTFKIIKPSLTDVVYLSFKRKTQVLYPKDIGLILLYGQVSPGCRVVEAGTGSGFLTAFLANAVKPDGMVYSYEVKEEYIRIARRNLELAGLLKYVTLKHADILNGIEESEVDAVILDMPTPWKVAPIAFNALRSGGSYVAFMPTINQVEKTVEELKRVGFIEVEAFETIQRKYKVARGETRPEMFMVGHTGYMVSARKP